MRNIMNIGILLVFLYFGLNIFLFVLPFILLFIVIRLVLGVFGGNRKNTNSRTYYRYNGQNAQDFNEFFRNSGFSGNYNGGSSNYGSNQNPYFEDKTRFYSVLGVETNANQDEIKKAYRNKAREYHPDRHAQSTESQRAEAERKFKEINEAYEKLKD